MSRWILSDPSASETWEMPTSPDRMTSPYAGKQINTADAGERFVGTTLPPTAKQWQWEGVIRTEDHYNALVRWAEKAVPIRVTDHLGRTFEVVIESFKPDERRPTRRVTWRLRYQMSALILRRIA